MLTTTSEMLAANLFGGVERLSTLCGNGGMHLLEEMLRCADGAMTGFGYPEMMRQVLDAFLANDINRAQDIFDAYSR